VGELFFVWECEPAPVGELFLYGTARTPYKKKFSHRENPKVRAAPVGELFFVWACEPAPVGELFLYGPTRT
jgi:hypothetical protein